MTEDGDFNQNQQTNFIQDSGIVKYRLDTNDAVEQVKLFLRGKVTESFFDPVKKQIVVNQKQIGSQKCNDKGFQAIVSLFANTLNKTGLQGYFEKKEEYDRFVSNFHEELSTELMTNRKDWGIKSNADFHSIVRNLMMSLRIGLTVAIKGRMMDSLSQTTKSSHVTTDKPGGIFAGLFGSR